jgi:hypothetical protein
VIDFSLERCITRPMASTFSSRIGETSATHSLTWLSPMMRALRFLLALVYIFLSSVFGLTSSLRFRVLFVGWLRLFSSS